MGAAFYFSPEAAARAEGIGLDVVSLYAAGRGAVLGDRTPPEVDETFFFFKSGPFAWNGLFGFYLPFATFWIWFFVMTYTIRRSLHRLDDAPTVSAASVEAA